MGSKICPALVALVLQAFVACVSVAAPLGAYGRLPTIEMVSISPDGQKLALMITTGDERRVAIRDLKAGTTKVFGAGSTKVRDLTWAGPDHLLIMSTTTANIPFVQAARAEWATTVDLNLATGKVTPLLEGQITRSADHLNVSFGLPMIRTIDGKPVAFFAGIEFIGGQGRLSLFRVDLESGREQLVDAGHPDTSDWLIGGDGEPLAETLYDSTSGRWSLRIHTESGWKQLPAIDAPIERPWLAGIGRDGTSILVVEPLDETMALREVSASSPAWGEPFSEKSFGSTIHDPLNHRLIGFHTLVGDDDRYEFLDAADSAAWNAIMAAYKGQRVTLVDWSTDRSRVVVKIDSPTEGASYAMVDLKNRTAFEIGSVYQALKPADIAEVRTIRYKAKDGLEISGYLTLPKGRAAEKLPLVVLPHGGPESRDVPGFDWWSQALASLGYAVLQPNFRGSSGFGAAFTEAGYGEWGRKMQTDLSDGVQHLAAQGIVDPKRVCIVGASYGGYAALAGAAFESATYRCAASVAGPSDMRRMLTWSKRRNGHDALRYWSRFMGADDPGDPVLTEISPAEHADRISDPGPADSRQGRHGRAAGADPVHGEGAEAGRQAGGDADHGRRGSLAVSRRDSAADARADGAFLQAHNPPL